MMTNEGLCSVIVPAYNAEAYIQEAIESVMRQDYDRWELIVVDDGSTDKTRERVESFSSGRIKFIQQANGGEAAARNTALEHANGEFLAFLDADDVYLPAHLKVAFDHLHANPEHGAVYTDGYYIDSQGNYLQTLSSNRRGPFKGDIFEEVVRASDVFGPPGSVVVRSNLVRENALRFDTDLIVGTDWDFLTRVSKLTKFGYVDEKTYLYRIHDQNVTVVTSNKSNLQRRFQSLARVRSKAIKADRFRSCSLETRTAVFYDLLVELLAGEPDRQNEVINWPEFNDLPESERARLLRLMASKAITSGNRYRHISSWLELSRTLNPSDRKGAILGGLYSLNPGLCERLLRVKTSRQKKVEFSSPFTGSIESISSE